MADTPALQLVGAVFNQRWRLTRLLGEGGMGAVYEAHSTHPGPTGAPEARAIKVLHPEFVTEEQILARFVAEAQAVSVLRHPNVTQIFESTRAEDGTPYLVMELLAGAPLSNFMTPGKGIALTQSAGIVLGVLQALQLAHSRGIVHRDLKPDNLFLSPDGRGNQTVKVLDFGIAKVMDAAGGMGSKTKTGVLLGTPGYMSPEQIKNSKGVDARSDLWSVGIIFYQLLTGQAAFPADNEFTRLTLVLTQEVTPIGDLMPELRPWNAFFQRALSKDLAHRFQSATEMSQAIASMLSGSSAVGREGGTVALPIPSGANPHPPTPAPTPAPAALGPGHGGPQTQASREPSYPHPAQHGAGMRPSHAPPGPGPLAPSHLGAQGNPSPHRASSPSFAPHDPAAQSQIGRFGQGAPLAGQTVAIAGPIVGSLPPPAPAPVQGPSTHMSAQRGGPPTLATGAKSPSIDVVAAPRIGVPIWLVAVIALATFGLGVLCGTLLG